MAEILSAQFKKLLDKSLNKIEERVFEDLTKAEAMIPTLFSVVNDSSAWWEYMDVSDVADIPQFTGLLEYLEQYPGYTTRIEPGEYAAGLRFERKFIDTNKWDVLRDRVAGLMEACFRTRELDGVKFLAHAFSSSFDFMTSEEALSLCNSSHTSKSGASTTTGFSNAGTSALDELSLEAARIAGNKFKGDIGNRIFTNFDELWVPDSLRKTALEITQTPQGLYSAEGTVNVQKGRWKVYVYKLLDDYDTNNWFIADSRLRKKHTIWVDAVKAETKRDFEEFNTLAICSRIYARWGFGHTNWRAWYGQNVS